MESIIAEDLLLKLNICNIQLDIYEVFSSKYSTCFIEVSQGALILRIVSYQFCANHVSVIRVGTFDLEGIRDLP